MLSYLSCVLQLTNHALELALNKSNLAEGRLDV